MSTRTIGTCVLAMGLLAAAAATQVRAGVDGDVRAGAYADAEAPMVGGGMLFDLEKSKHWFFNPNAELVFPDEGDLLTLNGDFHYDFASSKRVSYWVGAGPAVLLADDDLGGDNDNADFGANLLGGLGAVHGDVRPFGQVKVTLADDTEAALLFGIRF
jgi:hypothetical protein